MNSPDYFSIGSAGTSNTYGLYCDTPPMHAMAQQVYDTVNIPDREEVLYSSKDKYEDVTITLKCYSFTKDFNIESVYNWLRFASELSFNSDSLYYYKVKKVLGITPVYSGNGKNLYNISFVVSPFRYLKNESKQTVTTPASFTVNNTGNYWSRPKYVIYGSGDITITDTSHGVETSCTIYGVENSCALDAERLMAYKETTSSGVTTRTALMTSGVIPMLEVGTNAFTTSTTGTCTKVEIYKHTRSK